MSKVASDSPPDQPFESLRSPVRFREVLRRGDRRTVGGITVVSLFVDEPGTRIGLAVGRTLGSAVIRNRIKRRIRHACRHLDLAPGWDHVVIPAPSTARASFSSLVEWLRRATERP
ncbi:MAG: ribonuclease P protein component [Acidimicrobiia bacterium]